MLLKSLALATLLTAALLPPADGEGPDAGEYIVDSGHSAVLFRVTHLGVSAFWGRFNMVEGKLSYDPADASACSVRIDIPVESIDSNSAGRDRHLKSPDFFNAAEFPELTFRSTEVAAGRDGALEVTGQLTLLGQSKEVSFVAEPVGHGDHPQFGYRAGWEAEFSISRSAFGMTYMEGGLGDEVRLIVSLETIKA